MKKLYKYYILKRKDGAYIVGRKFLGIFGMKYAHCSYSSSTIREWLNEGGYNFSKVSYANNALNKYLEKEYVVVDIAKGLIEE